MRTWIPLKSGKPPQTDFQAQLLALMTAGPSAAPETVVPDVLPGAGSDEAPSPPEAPSAPEAFAPDTRPAAGSDEAPAPPGAFAPDAPPAIGTAVDLFCNDKWFPGRIVRSDAHKVYFKYSDRKYKRYEEPITLADPESLARLRASRTEAAGADGSPAEVKVEDRGAAPPPPSAASAAPTVDALRVQLKRRLAAAVTSSDHGSLDSIIGEAAQAGIPIELLNAAREFHEDFTAAAAASAASVDDVDVRANSLPMEDGWWLVPDPPSNGCFLFNEETGEMIDDPTYVMLAVESELNHR